jgi:hypothetical protein
MLELNSMKFPNGKPIDLSSDSKGENIHIVGGTEDQKKQVIERAQKYRQKSGAELSDDLLVEPSLEESQSITKAVDCANNVAKYYGSKISFDSRRVFCLKPESVEKLNRNLRHGLSNWFNQAIMVDLPFSRAILEIRVFHEVLHMASYHSAQIMPDGSDIPYREGISMRGRKKKDQYFSHAEEAIIAILSKRFFEDHIANNPEYKEDVRITDLIKKWLLEEAIVLIPSDKEKYFKDFVEDILIIPNAKKVFDFISNPLESIDNRLEFFRRSEQPLEDFLHERRWERNKFNRILDSIINNSNGSLDRDELFDDFARAHFTGNYLHLAKVIERVLGKGSFRKIAMELGDIKND